MKKLYRYFAVLMTAGMIFSGMSCSNGSGSGDDSGTGGNAGGGAGSSSHVHTYASAWSSDGTYHWHAATCGDTTEVKDKAEHTFGSWKVTKNRTVTEDGSKERSCSICSRKETALIPAGFDATYTWTETIQQLPAGTSGTAGTTGTYVLFGDWPQTLAASGVTFNAEPESNGYYIGSDGNYYAKCLENAYADSYSSYTIPTYSDGTTKVQQASAGSYRYFKVEPIEWRVLTDSYDYDGKTGTNTAKLLVAENILMGNVPYYYSCLGMRNIGTDTTIYPSNYKYSQIRAWLNGLDYYNNSNAVVTDYSSKGFLQIAFTSVAQSKINSTTVINSGISTIDADLKITCRADGYKADGITSSGFTDFTCADTEDKIFLLSEQEATTTVYGFASYDVYKGNGASESSRIRVTTDYAKANYAKQISSSGCGGDWWLRSPDPDARDDARNISTIGYAASSDDVKKMNCGVVPALCISF